MNDTSSQNTSRVQSLLEVINKHKVFTVVAIIVLLGTGIGMWASLPQRIATPVVPKHPLVQFPPPVLSYPVLPKTLNQEIAKIKPPWSSMTPAEKREGDVGVTSDGYTPVSESLYWSAPICAPNDLKVTLSPLDVPYSIIADAPNINVGIRNISSHPCDIPYNVQIGSWLGCEWTRPSPCSKSIFASFKGCNLLVLPVRLNLLPPVRLKLFSALSSSALCAIGAKGDIQAWDLPEIMIYSTSGNLVGLWASAGADFTDSGRYVGPPNGPLGMLLKAGQSSFYQLYDLTVQTENIFFKKLPGTYIAQAVIPLGYIPPSIGGSRNPPSHLPGVNWNVELSPPFKVYFYYTKPITFTVK